ncbi:short chain dehydrogenase [Dactylosporangium sucinum]|uniref:Short chain dehydrogenase n=1 Tax=Dactylosporangium sucinum TaxID=1424081 RepID=A0A917X4H3_9ACTN|nr:short chain dehydrogenase [Dactylosporangium sucinum]GGM64722.1 short chain dehydrogenase [Dactylosporangium sucinum]
MEQQRPRVLVVGGTGTIGRAVTECLADSYEVIVAARGGGDVQVDASALDSIHAMFAAVGTVDAIVSAFGRAVTGGVGALSTSDIEATFTGKVLPQLNLARVGLGHVRDGGSITLTSGVLSKEPVAGFAAVGMANGAIDGFCRAAAADLGDRVRINCVSPVFVLESGPDRQRLGLDDSLLQTAAETALAYRTAIESGLSGVNFDPRQARAGHPAAAQAPDRA